MPPLPEPPRCRAPPREVTFVIDTSGSMGGSVDRAGEGGAGRSRSTGCSRAIASTSIEFNSLARRAVRRADAASTAATLGARAPFVERAPRRRRHRDAPALAAGARARPRPRPARAPGGLPDRRRRRQRGRAVPRSFASGSATGGSSPSASARRPTATSCARRRSSAAARTPHRRRPRGAGADGRAVPQAREPGAHRRRDRLAGGARSLAAGKCPTSTPASRSSRPLRSPRSTARSSCAAAFAGRPWSARLPLSATGGHDGVHALWARGKIDALADAQVAGANRTTSARRSSRSRSRITWSAATRASSPST